MAIEGTLDVFQLPEIFQMISNQDKTGILTVQGESDIIAISFLTGRVVAADSLNQTLEEALGAVLSGQGLVSPNDFTRIAADHQAGKGRLVELLVDSGYIARPELLAALRLHTYSLLVELLSWRQGEFKFYTGDEVSYEEGFKPISIEELLIRAIEESGSEGNPTIPVDNAVYDLADQTRTIRVRPADDDWIPQGDDQEVFWVTEDEQQLLAILEGGATFSDLVTATGQNEYKARYGLHRLLEGEVVRRIGLVPRPEQQAPLEPTPTPEPLPEAELDLGIDETGLEASDLESPDLEPLVPPDFEPRDRPNLFDPSDSQEADLEAFEAAMESTSWRRRPGKQRDITGIATWVGRLLALVPAVAMVVLLVSKPAFLALPFPWQQFQRQSLEREIRQSIYQAIDRGAKTVYLLDGKFPTSLSSLVTAGLISEDELTDPLGRRLAYSESQIEYTVEAIAGGDVVPETAVTETITGNFLLDPDFLERPSDGQAEPIVLLD